MQTGLKAAIVAAGVVVLPAQAVAEKAILQPIPVGEERVRYLQGVPTLDLQKEKGAVQVTPLPMDHGSYAFSIAVYNQSNAPANFDVTNLEVTYGGKRFEVFTREQLEKKAKNRAMWATIALAAAGGLAAAAAASQTDTYTATTYTPRGTYRTIMTAPSQAGQVQAAVAAAGAGAGIAAVQIQLDKTREALGATTVQLTTVDPGDSYAGRAVIAKIKPTALPARISFVVNWNGEAYPFAFQLVKRGTPQPEFKSLSVASVAPMPVPDAAAPPAPTITPAITPVVPTPSPSAPAAPTMQPVASKPIA